MATGMGSGCSRWGRCRLCSRRLDYRPKLHVLAVGDEIGLAHGGSGLERQHDGMRHILDVCEVDAILAAAKLAETPGRGGRQQARQQRLVAGSKDGLGAQDHGR